MAKTESETPKNDKQPPEAPTPEAVEQKLAEEAEKLCTNLEEFVRRVLNAMPKATDLAELRAQQNAICELVQRALAAGQASGDKLAEVTAERDKFKDAAARARADFLNYQARTTKDLQRAEELALRGYISELLPVLDAVDLALKETTNVPPGSEHFRHALEMIRNAFGQVLSVRGLERIVVQCDRSPDPNEHEIVAKRRVDAAKGERPNTVVEEFRPGYLWKGLLLRPAQVLVTEAEKAEQKSA